jgi:hypothetical protein
VYSLKYCGTDNAINIENPMTKIFLGEFIFENWRIDIPIDPVASALRVASIGALIVEKMCNSFIA